MDLRGNLFTYRMVGYDLSGEVLEAGTVMTFKTHVVR